VGPQPKRLPRGARALGGEPHAAGERLAQINVLPLALHRLAQSAAPSPTSALNPTLTLMRALTFALTPPLARNRTLQVAGWLKTLPHFTSLSDAQARWPRCAPLFVTVSAQAVSAQAVSAQAVSAQAVSAQAVSAQAVSAQAVPPPVTTQRVKLAQNTESISFAAGEVILREGDPTWLGLALAQPEPSPNPNSQLYPSTGDPTGGRPDHAAARWLLLASEW
jgi:hypothetical protein